MSQDNSNEMAREVDFSGGIRGKYLERYRRWTSITSAVGPLDVSCVTSTGEPSGPKIVMKPYQPVHISVPVERGSVVVGRIAPRNLTAAHAV